MDWFLWRKPYPGLNEEQQINILSEVMLVGRGRECDVHCLSMYVSRRHLELIPKDGGICVIDLGSSNGTFVNQTKIPANVEYLLKIGDEVGVGNFSNDNKDCFIYEVRRVKLLSLEHKSDPNPVVEDLDEEDLLSPKAHPTATPFLEKGLKRCASDAVIVISDEDNEGNSDDGRGIVVETFISSKRLKIDEAVDSKVIVDERNCNSISKLKCEDSHLRPDTSDSGNHTLTLNEAGATVSNYENVTPISFKIRHPENVIPTLTSTPFVKDENSGLASSSHPNWSPITKDSSRYSQGSSANYTLDEEVIPIDLCEDEDDDIFPCSQMFAEEDVKPCVDDLEKNAAVVELSEDEEPPMNKIERDDDIVLISSSDEDEDCVEDANRWFKRLSQSSVKTEEPEDSTDFGSCSPKCATDFDFDFESAPLPRSSHKLEDCDIFETVEEEQPNDRQLIHIGEEVSEISKEPEKASDKLEVKEDSNVTLAQQFKETPSTSKETHTEKSKEKISKDDKRHSKKEKLKDEKKKERSKDARKTDSKSLKHRSSDKEKGSRNDKHLSHHSKHERRKKESNVSGKEESAEQILPELPLKEHAQANVVSSISKSDMEFDKLLSKSVVRQDPKALERGPKVSLERLDEDRQLCERYNLPVSGLSPAPTSKKGTRKIELIDAPPNPPRRAINRGISITTAKKMFDSDRRKSTEEPKATKSRDEMDPVALRKEKLAMVAAKRAAKNKSSSESKRAAPAKIKVTSSNRGFFLTESDEPSPVNKIKSRKDILGSIKIPKVKDKSVSHLPAKSPLQAMDMSWEKKSPPQSALQPSNKNTVSVEIPTGPQPKKRVAQVPPPGFYEDLRPSPVPLSSAPGKSCLSASSKHNIENNGSKPIALKKRVRFKENIEEVFFIEKLPNTRPVSSSRDADRPKPMNRIAPVKLPKGPNVPNDETLLQDVIQDISKWNPLWLKEEKDLPPDVVPPVVSNMTLPPLPKTEYLDFREYYSTMYPLLMLELWNGVSKEYNSHYNDARNNMIMAVDTASPAVVHLKPERTLTNLSCHMVIDNRPQAEHPRLGSLVVIDLALKDASGKLVISPVFGYVSFDSKDRLRNSDQFHKELVQHCRNPAFKIRLCIMIRERKNYTFALERVMRIKHVKYIRGDLRLFQAMKNLEYLHLQYSVISPLAASEDFTLPDVSKKSLAFPEQLNSTQEKIVLQTAEVCLQDKPKICLIQGPPGTGKTQVIESLVMHLLYRDRLYSRANRERGLIPRILVCAPSNNAVDLLVGRLLRRRAKFEREHRFKMVRVGTPQQEDVKGVSLQELANVAMKQEKAAHDLQGLEMDKGHWEAKLRAIENIIRDLTLNNKPIPEELGFRVADFNRRLRVLEERQKQQNHAPQTSSKQDFVMERETKKKILRGADIIATTLNSCVIKIMETVFPPTNQEKYHFHVCIVDEATQCLEVETLIPLLLNVKTLVLVGDPNQLPATILSKIAREKGLGTSLFARLQNVVPKAVQLLDTQYRMHPEILRWPNKYFYNRRLKSPDQILSYRDSRVFPYTVISLPFLQDPKGEHNPGEAQMVLELADLLIAEKVVHSEFRVGIVTPYQSQRRTLESMIEMFPKRTRMALDINTIDSFQGQEKDIIILSCVRTNGVGFLSDRQRVNVALTRAKYALFICGNFSSLDRDSMWNNLLSDARQRNRLIELHNYTNADLWNHICKK